MAIEAVSDIQFGGVSAFSGGAYAPLNSPAFTGTPTAPTAADDDESDRIATTLHVKSWWANHERGNFLGGYVAEEINSKLAQRPRGLSFYVGGKPDANEVIASGVFPYNDAWYNLSAANCVVRAVTAATASTVFSIRKNGTQIGTITFAAGATVATVNLTQTGVNQNELITITAPATPDATLAGITGLLSEAR